MVCQDQFGYEADISFGDIWLKEMKKNPIKHTSCIIRTENALRMYRSAVKAGVIVDDRIDDEHILRSQKRALVFKWNCAKAKWRAFADEGKRGAPRKGGTAADMAGVLLYVLYQGAAEFLTDNCGGIIWRISRPR